MGVVARISSKGQIAIQVVVGLIKRQRAVPARTPDLIELAGSVPMPAEARGLSWNEIRRRAWASRARS